MQLSRFSNCKIPISQFETMGSLNPEASLMILNWEKEGMLVSLHESWIVMENSKSI